MSGFPSFFQSNGVDDNKYESLLEDLRTHDLLDSNENNVKAKAPPGFSITEKGNVPTTADLEWARGQHAYTQLQGASKSSINDDDDSMDLKGLGLAWKEEEDHMVNTLGLDTTSTTRTVEKKAHAVPSPSTPPLPRQPPMPNAWPRPKMAPVPTRGQGGNMLPNGGALNTIKPPPPPPISSKWMTVRDIQFVMQQQLKQLRSSDPFSDDYYFHNLMHRRGRQHLPRTMEASPSPGEGPPAAPSLPTPSWQLQHVEAVNPTLVKIAAASREWEAKNQVLGRNEKTDLYRPRERFQLTKKDDEENEEEMNAEGALFSSRTWSKRQLIDQGWNYLLALQDARHILDARGINPQDFFKQSTTQLTPTLEKLRDKVTNALIQLGHVLGVSLPTTPPSQPTGHRDTLWSILSVVKGQRLVCRSLLLLNPEARYTLLPMLLEYFIATAPPLYPTVEETSVQERLSQTLVLTLLYHPPLPPLHVMVEGVGMSLSGHTSKTLTVILQDRARAEVLQALLQHGGNLASAADCDPSLQSQWVKWQTKFVEMASAMQAPQ